MDTLVLPIFGIEENYHMNDIMTPIILKSLEPCYGKVLDILKIIKYIIKVTTHNRSTFVHYYDILVIVSQQSLNLDKQTWKNYISLKTSQKEEWEYIKYLRN